MNMLQRSEEWFEARRGRFTASQIHRLLGSTNKDGSFGVKTKGAIDSYAFEKAVETLYGVEPEPEFLPADMQRGVELEPLAFELFQSIKEKDFLNVEECGFFSFLNHAGASPDGLVGDTSILEIKCPRRNKFFKYVANGKSEIELKYMAQMQMQMMATERGSAFFFNYYIEEGREYHHTIEVERNEEMIKLIKERILIATELKEDYIFKLKENKQF